MGPTFSAGGVYLQLRKTQSGLGLEATSMKTIIIIIGNITSLVSNNLIDISILLSGQNYFVAISVKVIN